MSPSCFKTIRLDRNQARKLIAKLSQDDEAIDWTGHAMKQMADRSLSAVDVLNVIRSPSSKMIHEGEPKNGCYTYLIGTNRIHVAVGFNSTGTVLSIVTAIRKEWI